MQPFPGTLTYTKNIYTPTPTCSILRKSRSNTHTHTYIHPVWCICPHSLPGTPVPCAVSAPARAPWGQPGLRRASAGHCGWAALFWAWPWHPALPYQFLSGCQAAGREGSTHSAAPAQQPGGGVERTGATWNLHIWSWAAF